MTSTLKWVKICPPWRGSLQTGWREIFSIGGKGMSYKIVLNVHNEEILDKLLWILRHFESEGIEVIEHKKEFEQVEWDNGFIEKHWREIVLNTNSADLDDDERLYEACREYYHAKYSD